MEIVIADSIESDRNRLCNHIKSLNCCERIFLTDNGAEAFQIMKNEKIDCAFLDMVMPKKDGITVAMEAKECNFSTKIVLMSGFLSQFMEYYLSLESSSIYLEKPFHFPCIKKVLLNDEKSNGQVLERENISELLEQIGMLKKWRGYDFVLDAIMIAMEDFNAFSKITEKIYPKVAQKYNTTTCNVERNIRHSIELTWNQPRNVKQIETVFGKYCMQKNCKPTNKAFIRMMYQKVKTR